MEHFINYVSFEDSAMKHAGTSTVYKDNVMAFVCVEDYTYYCVFCDGVQFWCVEKQSFITSSVSGGGAMKYTLAEL